jgi:hypothetical protein
MRESAKSEAANVRQSKPYVAGSPIVAIRTPARAGPPIMPTVPRSESSALAAVSSSRSTSRGIIASSDGRWMPSRAAIAAATRKSTHTCGSASSEFATSAPAQRASESSESWTIRRRSFQSASAPPYSAAPSSGTSSTALSSPTISDEPVRA